ncbi:hypothetical protein ACFRQM_36320 [Streptomyces sp. NPDC056831]|uniref:hypothetical protein n=1 Tax=Streptomyces sp. NPDC056831 TaxID=3345954 RepID=UPI0036787553
MNGLPVGEEHLASSHRRPEADQQHEPRRPRDTGPLGMGKQLAVTEPRQTRPPRSPPDVVDRREAVRIAVAVRHQHHDVNRMSRAAVLPLLARAAGGFAGR